MHSGVLLGGEFYGAPGGLNNLDAKMPESLAKGVFVFVFVF